MEFPITINIPEIVQFCILLLIDTISILFLTKNMYYARHHDRDGFVTYTLFNIFLFITIYFLSKLDVGMTI